MSAATQMKRWTMASCISSRSPWEVKTANSLNAKPQKELCKSPCKKEASGEFLPLMAVGEKDQGVGTRTTILGAQWQAQEARAAPDISHQLSWNGHQPHLSTVHARTAIVPRSPAAGGSVPLPEGPQSDLRHVPRSPKTPHSLSGPERRPVKGYSLSWVPPKLLASSLPSAEKKGEQLTGWRLRSSPLGETKLLASGDPWP